MTETEYRELTAEEICRELFRDFIRRQEVVKCYRKEKGEWVIRDDPFIDDWSEEDYRFLVKCLKNTVKTGGVVYGAFCGGKLKGFASVECGLFGGEEKYLDLSSIHVSADMRGHGIGKSFSLRQRNGRESTAGKSCIYRPTPLWRRRRFTGLWAVRRQKFTTSNTLKRSPLTVSLNVRFCPKTYF